MLTFVPHKINETYNKVEFYRVNKEHCNNEVYKDLSPTAILLLIVNRKSPIGLFLNKTKFSYLD